MFQPSRFMKRSAHRAARALGAAALLGSSLSGVLSASAAGRSQQPRAGTFPQYTATAINDPNGLPTAQNVTNSGAVVGYMYPSGNGPFTAFIRTSATLIPLPGLGGDAFALAANNHGDAVGESRATATGPYHAVLWRGADRQHPVDLSTALGTTGESHALGINDAGDIVGVIGVKDGSGSAFFLPHTGGAPTIIGPGRANAVNNAATPQVAVYETTGQEKQAGVWDAVNGFQPAPVAHSEAVRINDQGVLLGNASAEAGGTLNIPFIWSPGQASAHQLNFTGRATGINSAASPTVVGNTANGPVLWKEDTVAALKSLLANPGDVDVEGATGINDGGKISATGFSGSWLFSPGSASHVDLEASVSATPSTVTHATDDVAFTAAIKNYGPDAASNVQVTPVINGHSTPSLPLSASISSGQTVQTTFHIKPADFGVTGGTFIITLSVTSDGIEPNPDTTHRNSASTTVTVGGGSTDITLQSVAVTPNPVQVPKSASVVLTFSGNIPTGGVTVTLQVTDVPTVGTYTKDFSGVHADSGKPKQATLTFETSQLASLVTAPIQVHVNAIFNGAATNGPAVTINPPGPPPSTVKLKTVSVPQIVNAPAKLHVAATLTGKVTSETIIPVHFVLGGVNTEYSLKVPAGASSGSLDISTDDYLLSGQTMLARVTATYGGVTLPRLPSGSNIFNVTINPLYLDSRSTTWLVVPPSGGSGGELKVVLAFTGALPAAGVDVKFNGLFLSNKIVHVTPDQSGGSKATVHLSTSEVTGTVSGNVTATFHLSQTNQQTITSPKLTIRSAIPPPALAIQSISVNPATIDGTSAVTATIHFTAPLKAKTVVNLDVYLGEQATGTPLKKLKATFSTLDPSKLDYDYAIPLATAQALVALAPAGDTKVTVKASSTKVPGTATFTATIHK